jgi:hypothetical protein
MWLSQRVWPADRNGWINRPSPLHPQRGRPSANLVDVLDRPVPSVSMYMNPPIRRTDISLLLLALHKPAAPPQRPSASGLSGGELLVRSAAAPLTDTDPIRPMGPLHPLCIRPINSSPAGTSCSAPAPQPDCHRLSALGQQYQLLPATGLGPGHFVINLSSQGKVDHCSCMAFRRWRDRLSAVGCSLT